MNTRILLAGLISMLLALPGAVPAQTTTVAAAKASAEPVSRQSQTAQQRVDAALDVVRTMQAEPRMKAVLEQAKGVLLVPTYGKAAVGVGAQGGAGLLLLKTADGSWSGPAFYNLGGLSVGLQVGAAGGPMALVLNNDKAVDEFMKRNNLSLSAEAGLTVVNWAKLAQGSVGNGDVIAWTNTEGLFGDVATIGVNDIRFNQTLTNAYYGRTITPRDVATGTVRSDQAQALQQALAAASRPTS